MTKEFCDCMSIGCPPAPLFPSIDIVSEEEAKAEEVEEEKDDDEEEEDEDEEDEEESLETDFLFFVADMLCSL